MKRSGVPRLAPDEPQPMAAQNSGQIQQGVANTMHTLSQSAQPQILGTTTMLSVGGGFGRAAGRGGGGAGGATPALINYMKAPAPSPAPPSAQYAPPKQPPLQVQPRIKQQPNLGPLAGLGRQSPGPPPPGAPSHGPPPPGASPHGPPPPGASPHGPHAPQAQFQRLKVEDALSYLDQVKYKFNTQPQVYNDFLDIMKEFKSQTIDTPGVITRVSNLFKGHPELIVGFNTFLPPGYKIEVQSNGQVSVSMPSPTSGAVVGGAVVGGVVGGGVGGVGAVGGGAGGGVVLTAPHAATQLVHLLPVAQSVSNAIVHNLSVSAPGNTLHQISHAHQQMEAAVHHAPGVGAQGVPASAPAPPGQPVEFNHAIEYVNKIKSRFARQPDKYKRFLEILHAYQRGHRDGKEPAAKQQTEQEVYAQVAKLFENQDDLLAEFGQFLPDAKAVTKGPDREPFAPDAAPAHHLAALHAHPHTHTHSLSHAHHQVTTETALMQTQQRVEAASERFPALAPASPPPHAPPPPPAPHATHAPHAAPHTAPHAHPLHALHPHHQHQHPQHPQVTKHTSAVQTAPATQHHHLKRSPSFSSGQPSGVPPAKKSRVSGLTGATVRDVSYAEAAKIATQHDFNFFDKARKALRTQHVYDNFLRCLLLFTNEIISSSELLSVTAPFLCRHPELQKWLQDFVGPPSPPHTPTNTNHSGFNNKLSVGVSVGVGVGVGGAVGGVGGGGAGGGRLRYEAGGAAAAQLRLERPQGDLALDIDLSTCKRLGTSYCALPREAAARRCSGRTPLCKEVLNDTWVSFPTWSEDSTFVTSRKTQYEEYIYRCEDERFELDVVIETNASTIRVLEGVQKKLSRMSGEEAAKYRLDDCLGGHSPTVHQRALRRIYGDKAVDIIAGLKKNPVVAVPVVLRRLKAKEEEWREAQKGFNKQWREQNEKYYLKSLDHQGINFKQNDLKAMRSKSLFNEVESAYAAGRPGPHLVVDYNMQSRQEAIKIVRDTAELLVHHARRQASIQKAEKRRIKQLLRHFLPDLFSHPRLPPSDDERDDGLAVEDREDAPSPESPSADRPTQDNDKGGAVKQDVVIKQESSESDNASDKSGKNNKNNKENKPKNNNNTEAKDVSNQTANSVKRSSSNEDQMSVKSEVKAEPMDIEDDFRDYPPNEARFVCTSSWYLFLRVHAAVCQRLAAARRTALALALAHDASRAHPSVATALRLKPNNLPADVSSPSEYYNVLLELVKGVLDGNMESSSYEDAAREMLGIKAYPAFTLDKLVSIAVRQLQHCVSEPWSARAAEMAARGMRGARAYVRRAAARLRPDHTAFLVRVYGGDECKVTFELLEGTNEGRTSPQHNNDNRLSPTNQTRPGTNGDAVSRLAAWSLYTERYVRPDAHAHAHAHAAPPRNKPVFLVRNARARGGYTHNAHTQAPHPAPSASASASAPSCPAPHHRRKPPRLHDSSECTLTSNLRCRLLACRPFQLYQAGALRAARVSQPRLAARRQERFRAWLRRRRLDV